MARPVNKAFAREVELFRRHGGSLRMSDIAAVQSGLWFIAYPVIGQLAFLAFVIAGVAAMTIPQRAAR